MSLVVSFTSWEGIETRKKPWSSWWWVYYVLCRYGGQPKKTHKQQQTWRKKGKSKYVDYVEKANRKVPSALVPPSRLNPTWLVWAQSQRPTLLLLLCPPWRAHLPCAPRAELQMHSNFRALAWKPLQPQKVPLGIFMLNFSLCYFIRK